MSENEAAASRTTLRPWAVGAGVVALVLMVGGARPDVAVLAVVAGGAFGDLVRRAAIEPGVPVRDPTDVASALGFLVILLAAAYDAGRSARGIGTFSPMNLVGLGVIGAGCFLRSRAARSLGASFAVRLGVRDGQALIQTGPYRRLRHPSYTGLLLVALGTALSLSSPSALAATFCVWLPVVLVRIAREERQLLARFDGAYRAYMRRTWRLIVGIY